MTTAEMLAQIHHLETTPLSKLVEETTSPQVTGDTRTMGFHQQDSGIAVNVDRTVQIASGDQSLVVSPAGMVLSSSDIFVSGHVQLMPRRPGQALSINGGELNPLVIPPAPEKGSSTSAPMLCAITPATDAGTPVAVPSVIVPYHTHLISGSTTIGVEWVPDPHRNFVSPVENLVYQYLFGASPLVAEQLSVSPSVVSKGFGDST